MSDNGNRGQGQDKSDRGWRGHETPRGSERGQERRDPENKAREEDDVTAPEPVVEETSNDESGV